MTNDKKNSDLQKNIRNAKKGNFDAAFQLVDYYQDGKYIEKDKDESDKYLSLAFNLFKKQNIRINEVTLDNFRSFSDFKLHLPSENLTVIIGNNGAGKTTILDSIAMSMSWLHNRIVKNGGNGDTIDNLDIKLGVDAAYSSIVSKFKLNKSVSFDMELAVPAPASSVKKKNIVADVTKIGSFYKRSNDINESFNFPLLSYYTVGRSNAVSRKDVGAYDETLGITKLDKFDGYQNSLNGKADFQSFFRWYKRLDDISIRRESNKISSINSEEFKKQLEILAQSDESARLLLEKLNNEDKIEAKEATVESFDVEKIKKLVNKVISYFMNGYGNLEIQVEPFLGITVEKNGEKLNVLQLSQGEKSLLALVVDIARRLIILNPSLDNPLEGSGIVLIDEYDMHIHPAWQRSLISGLPKAFKNCQFIITTHSPQMLGEVKPSQIIILESDENNNISYSHPEQSYGLTSNQILNYLMKPSGTNSDLVRNSDVEDKIKYIQSLVDDERFKEAEQKIEELEVELNGTIPELTSAKIDIDLNGWDE
ncbi:ATPase [Photobacterium frigidiphilum]|uniref:ATPase n=1 Tax=Photobacterium frigidiphilum TaxID=264736 RepID=A0A2T3JGS9_9GAMM|nr:AAA family ATPase [Photobacterium frigidiphilum]PSU48154.1 ATPase [Photobacterium frigidiphilum]